MKKFISVLLVCIMVSASFGCAYADDGDKVAQLILSVKDRFDISDELFVFDDYSKDEHYGATTFYLSWKSKADDEYSSKPYISVNIDESGEVQYYRLSRTYSNQVTLPKFSEEEIFAKAKAYVHKISPERYLKLAEPVAEGDNRINIRFERIEGDIPVAGDYIYVELSPQDLSLISYSANWTDAPMRTPENILDLEQAKKAYTEGIGYELLYNIKTKNSEIEDIYLSYESKDSSAYIDAFTGEPVKRSMMLYKTAASGAMNDMAVEESARQLSPEEQKMVEEINKMISKDDAEKIARSIPEFGIRKDAQVNGYSVSANRYGDYVAHINFGISKKDDYYHASVSIDANTKEVISFSESEKNEGTLKSFDKDKAKEKAMAFLNKYYKDKMELCKDDFVIGEKSDYRFYFDRYVNGVRVKNNGISISVNEYTGDIDSFSYTWAKAEFPAKDNVVAPNFIYKDVLKDGNFRLQYVTATEYTYDEKTGKQAKNVSAELVYAVMESSIYDALTGNKIDSRGEAIKEKFNGYTDLKGHYSEKAATELAKIGIYFEGGLLSPDKEISQAEFLKFVYQAIYGNYYGNDTDIYRSLINNGILTEAEIGQPLTRIDAVRYLINALGFKKAAEIEGIYNCTFTDVDSKHKGYAAIAGGLGIINANAPVFRSSDILTRGEAVTVIHNYLTKNR